ncbi:MAG: ferritin family protein [Magnetococcales bacterium]|nr:ferritin family protein [Magnetococcales bacterium]NGZ27184.1 ferritin family protein [Magnetococcales bacterium]
MDRFIEVIEFAIQQEESEAEFYEMLATRAESQAVRNVLLDHAKQEWEHKARLQEILASHRLPGGGRRFRDPDLQIADYTVAAPVAEGELGYQDALILAAKREKAAERLYRDMASQTDDPQTANLFLFLAEQEAKHRHQIERDYDDMQKEG